MFESVEEVMGVETCRAFIRQMLGRIRHYRMADRVDVVLVDISDVIPLSRYAVRMRVECAVRLTDASIAAGVKPYDLVLHEDNGAVRLVFPPVVEKRQGENYVVDGVHRFLAATASGLTSIRCVCVQGSALPELPCEAGSWEELVVDEVQRPLNDILPNLNRKLFRHLTSLFNSDEFVFGDRASAFKFVQKKAGENRRKE